MTDANGRREASLAARVLAGLREYYEAPHRRAMARARREEDDLLMLYACGEALGLPNPAAFYTMELLPVLLDELHDWHTRMGMERWPGDDGLSCC